MQRILVVLMLLLCTLATARADDPPSPPPTPTPTPAARSSDDVEIRVEPIIWLPTADSRVNIGDTRFARTLTINGVITPSEILPDLHFAFAGRVEGRDGRLGGFGEVFYLSAAAPARVAGSGGTLNTRLTMAQVSGFYRLNPGEIPVDVVVGMRLGSISNNLDFNSSQFPVLGNRGFDVTRTNTSVNPIIGLRVAFPLSKKIFFQVYGDYGGFGIGDNQQTWRAQGILGYDMNEKIRLFAGYTAINFSSERGRNTTFVKFDNTFRGPVLGISLKL